MEMREKIARAIRTELRNQGVIWEDEPFDPNQLMMGTGECADMGKLVHAVLTAIRESSEAMLNAGELLWVNGDFDENYGPYGAARVERRSGDNPDLPGLEDLFATMIDAALAPAS